MVGRIYMSFGRSSHKSIAPSPTPDWWVSFAPPAHEPHVSTPTNNRRIVAGDVWLANRAALLQQLNESSLSDLEIIATLWERHGEQCLLLLQGMFAFVVWDEQQKSLLLVRDRVGARTLYYSTDGATRWIAPRLQTLAQKLSPTIDLVALRDYLSCAFVPGERTMWSGIREVRPGTIVRLPSNEAKPYWQIEERLTETDQPLGWHAQRLRSLLDEVIQESLPHEEAVGCYLSGGLDSSLVAALAKKLHTHPVHTYSIHFGAATPNELEFSALVAAHCQTKHHVIEITPTQM